MAIATTNVVVLANVTLPIGVTSFGPVTPPSDLSNIQISIDRTLFTSLTLLISLSLEVSRDSGATFFPWVALQTRGGALTNPRTLLPVTNDFLAGALPVPTDALTRIRGSVTANEVAVTTVTLTMS